MIGHTCHNCRLHSHPTATYESASTRGFYKGRTDTVRSCTSAALAFAKTMTDPTATVSIGMDNNNVCALAFDLHIIYWRQKTASVARL